MFALKPHGQRKLEIERRHVCTSPQASLCINLIFQGRDIITSQVLYLRSSACAKVPLGIGLMAWASGASKQLMDVLHHACLSIPYTTLNTVIASLAESSLESARKASKAPFALMYDNVNCSSSIYVEQAPGMMSKVQSGTFGVVYELPYAKPQDMEVQKILENIKTAPLLTMDDLRPTASELQGYIAQTKITIVNILLTYVPDGSLDYLKDSPALKRPVVRAPHPDGYKTVYHPLRVITIEEASIEGNLEVQEDFLVRQLEKDLDDLEKYAVPSINDQLTNARIRGAQLLRRKDTTTFNRREQFQIAFGVFHMIMNLIWGLLENFRVANASESSTLKAYFVLLEKTRLGKEHPDYHTLLAALTQIVHGLILNAWGMVTTQNSDSGAHEPQASQPSSSRPAPNILRTLSKLVETKPTAEQLLEHAETIINTFTVPDYHPASTDPKYPAVPMEKPKNRRPTDDGDLALDSSEGERGSDEEVYSSDSEASSAGSSPGISSDASSSTSSSSSSDAGSDQQERNQDSAFNNTMLLTRDLLYVLELVNAVSSGDWGRIENILPTLACMFRGVGSNDYSTEVLHLLHSLRRVWTPEFAYVTILSHEMRSILSKSQ